MVVTTRKPLCEPIGLQSPSVPDLNANSKIELNSKMMLSGLQPYKCSVTPLLCQLNPSIYP